MNDVLALLFMIILAAGLSTKSALATDEPDKDADKDLCCRMPESQDCADR
ncbi:MAG: hypothetical protein ACOX35_07195 [Bacillota bacterium]|nr:hypothetical protein [Candidatus Fermentithermobacillaceae bacterium]